MAECALLNGQPLGQRLPRPRQACIRVNCTGPCHALANLAQQHKWFTKDTSTLWFLLLQTLSHSDPSSSSTLSEPKVFFSYKGAMACLSFRGLWGFHAVLLDRGHRMQNTRYPRVPSVSLDTTHASARLPRFSIYIMNAMYFRKRRTPAVVWVRQVFLPVHDQLLPRMLPRWRHVSAELRKNSIHCICLETPGHKGGER